MRYLFVALLLAGCKPTHCDPAVKSTVELRDGSGALTLAWKGNDLCDSHMRRVGALETRADGVSLKDAAGALRLDLVRESASAAAGRDRSGPHLRLYRDARELRVLGADGVPLGSVVPEGLAAAIYNPASVPIAKVAMRDRDAVVTDMAGSAQNYLVPAHDPGSAGVFGIPKLDPAEALAIYIYWSR
jgi:hypothetical protein